MASAPRPKAGPLKEKAERFVVLLGDVDGNAPAVDDETPWLIPLSASLSAGSSRLDTMSFAVDLVKAGVRLRDTTVPVSYHRQVELRRLDESGEPTELVAWGMIASNSQEIEQQERIGITARVDHFLFGDVLRDTSYWFEFLEDPLALEGDEDEEEEPTGEVRRVHLPVIFNPEIDKKIEPNRSDKHDEERGDSFLFYHPESHRMEGASELQDQVADHWTLSEAAHWLCWACNSEEKYITNPTLDELQAAFAGHDDGVLRNFSLPFGLYLDQALDELLTPFSFGWHLVHTLEEEERKTSFRFFRRGEGSRVQIYMQAPDETLDPTKTVADSVSANYDIARLANRIICRGSIERREATFKLIPGWPLAGDGVDFEKLDETCKEFGENPFAGRKWVLNEAGDYSKLRPAFVMPVFAWLFDKEFIHRRRRFLRCLSESSSGDDPDSNGYVVEWWDENQDGAVSQDYQTDPGWVRVRWPFSVLEKECGILFTGPLPPRELWDLFQSHPENTYLRITACIEGDTALESIAEKRLVSPNGEDVTLFLNVRDRFHDRKVLEDSVYDGKPADEKDDATLIENYAKAIRDQQDAAEVSVAISLRGVNHPQYKIGQLVDRLEGRNLTFNANAAAAGNQPRRLQIVGKNLTFRGGQRTELLIETFELEKSEVGATL